VTFAPMLKHGTFPLAEILDVLVRAGEDALGHPVEIEFAVRLPQTQLFPDIEFPVETRLAASPAGGPRSETPR
jgi:hypothetical protein